MKILLQILLSSLFFYGCLTKKERTVESSRNTEIVSPPRIEPTSTEEIKNNYIAETSPQVALNPAHGIPGHRCDIEVGKPLNSAPKSQTITSPALPATQPSMGPINSTTTLPNELAQPGTAKLNPAHGQPGHDCAVTVGAPLKN